MIRGRRSSKGARVAGIGGSGVTLLVFAAASTVFGIAALVASKMLAPRHEPGERDGERGSPEKGVGPWPSRAQMTSGVLSVVFAAQLVLLYPWAAASGSLPTFALVEIAILLATTGAGLVHALGKEGRE